MGTVSSESRSRRSCRGDTVLMGQWSPPGVPPSPSREVQDLGLSPASCLRKFPRLPAQQPPRQQMRRAMSSDCPSPVGALCTKMKMKMDRLSRRGGIPLGIPREQEGPRATMTNLSGGLIYIMV